MKTISAERFGARCLTIIDEVKLRREPVVMTRKEKPVARRKHGRNVIRSQMPVGL